MSAPTFHRILDRVDAGLDFGTIEGRLPDGTTRIIGSRGEGPYGIVNLHSWKALLRLTRSGSVGWYEAWERGEWESPDAVQIFDLFTRNRSGLKSTGRAGGLFRWLMKLQHWRKRND